MTLNILIVSSFVISLAFFVVPCCVVWLYVHRYKDWPRAWVLLIIGISMGSCSLSRFVHGLTYILWPRMDLDAVAMCDAITAMLALAAAGFAPWAAWEIRKIPTPAAYKDMAEKAAKTMIAEADAAWAKTAKEKAEKRVAAFKAMLSDYSAMDPALKDRMLKLVEDI